LPDEASNDADIDEILPGANPGERKLLDEFFAQWDE
jgi:hypothetical protein